VELDSGLFLKAHPHSQVYSFQKVLWLGKGMSISKVHTFHK
jgi:hypothetical protein